MTIHNSLAELIGNTPLVKLNHIPQAAGVKATIAVKVEYFNPGGSSKDRIAERIIDAAEQSGQLKPGGVMALAIYYGGENGYGERDALLAHLKTLDDRKYSVLVCDWANRRNDPPIPAFIFKD